MHFNFFKMSVVFIKNNPLNSQNFILDTYLYYLSKLVEIFLRRKNIGIYGKLSIFEIKLTI